MNCVLRLVHVHNIHVCMNDIHLHLSIQEILSSLTYQLQKTCLSLKIHLYN